MKKKLLYFFLTFIWVHSLAQKNSISHLKEQLNTVSEDTTNTDIFIQLSDAYTSINLDSSILYYEKAVKQPEHIKNSSSILSAQKKIFLLLVDIGEYTKAKQFADQGLVLGYQLNDNNIICRSLLNLANLNWILSNLDQTLIHLNEALNYAEKTQSLKLKGEVINSFGMLYGDQEEYEKAYDYMNQSFEISKELNDINGQVITLNNKGRYLILQKKYKEALPFFEQAIQLCNLENANVPTLNYEFVTANKGECLIGLGQGKEGLSFLDTALNMAVHYRHTRTIIIFNKAKALALFDMKKYAEAIESAKIGVTTSKETNYVKELPALCDILTKTYKVKEDYKSSLIWLEEKNKATKEITERQKKKELNKIEAIYGLQQKETENQILLLRNKNQKTLIALLLLSALIFCFFVYYFFKQQQQKKIEMFRQRIAADLHDEVGSNLNNITRIAKGLKSYNNNQKINQGIDQLVKNSNTTIRNIIDVIWALDNEESKLGDLIEKMESFLDEIRITNKDIKIDFIKKNLSENTLLSLDTKHHLLMVFKEAINNIQKHTFPLSITIKLDSYNQNLKLKITNQFQTKKENPNSTGRGIINIKRRIKDLGGEVEIMSNKKEFQLQIKLNNLA